ncbi:MAG: hypothetical protein SF066_23680 [Thermoanaerobaculia bacterium]|nr:hypothetical protein [Thermoanaerobaculia bacterium]
MNLWRVLRTLSVPLVLAARPAWGAEDFYEPPGPSLLDGLWVLAGILAIGFLFYKGLYPYLLRHYRADDCKTFFWALFSLYSLTWLHLSMYLFFDYGFRYGWVLWMAVFLSVLFALWFLIAFVRLRRVGGEVR